jgi:Zn-dependent protease with chaperone function/predicted Zn-dependent protease
MPAEWPATYLDGRVCARQPARVRLTPDALEISLDAGPTLRWPYGELVQRQGFYPGEQVRLEPRGQAGDALIVLDPTVLTAIRRTGGAAARHIHDPARRWVRGPGACLAALGVVGLVAGLYLWAIPAMATAVAPHVPVAWEQRVGQTAVDYMVPARSRCTDPVRTPALESIVATLAASLSGSPFQFRLVVADYPAVNAFAAPGGHIVVFRGLLEQTRSAEELAGVLAHELQHVVQRHVARAIVQQASTGLVLTALTGDASGLVALEAARTLGTLRYSRQHELEADAEGLRMMAAAGIDPAGMIGFFEGLKGTRGRGAEPEPGLLRYLATHPGSDERLGQLTALAARLSRPTTKLLATHDWADVRAVCGRAQARPRAAALPRAAGTIHVVPVGDFPVETLDRLERYYSDRFGLRIERLPAVPIESEMFDASRGQLVAEEVVAAIKRHRAPQTGESAVTLIGLTAGDLYIRQYQWRFAFAYRESPGVAVVSAARMDPAAWGLRPDPDLLDERLRKMVSKQIGVLHFRLAESADRNSVMFGPILGLDDLDSAGEDF